jgi:hypothetical protein
MFSSIPLTATAVFTYCERFCIGSSWDSQSSDTLLLGGLSGIRTLANAREFPLLPNAQNISVAHPNSYSNDPTALPPPPPS